MFLVANVFGSIFFGSIFFGAIDSFEMFVFIFALLFVVVDRRCVRSHGYEMRRSLVGQSVERIVAGVARVLFQSGRSEGRMGSL